MMYVVGKLRGVTQLDNMVYVVTAGSSIIRTLRVDTLSSLGDIHIQGMVNPSDIVVCRHDRQLYVADSGYNDCIWRVSADDHSYVKWQQTVSGAVVTLSLTSRGLLVTSDVPPSLREYNMTDRQLLRVVQLPQYMTYIRHGVETTRGTFVIGHPGRSQECQWAVS